MHVANSSVKFIFFIKSVFLILKVMSQSNRAAVPSCSISDPTPEDESRLKKASLVKLIGSERRKLNFLQIFGDGSHIPSKPLVGVPSETLALRCQQPNQNISIKSLPPLGARDSLENILLIRRYGEFPRRNLLRSFVNANSLERRPRRRLCQNKGETVTESNKPNTLKSQTCPEVNVKNLRYQLAREKKIFNRFSIVRFGQNVRNQIKGEALRGEFGSALYQGLEQEVVPLCKDDTIDLQILSSNSKLSQFNHCSDVEPAIRESELRPSKASKLLTTLNEFYSSVEMLHSLEKLNLNPAECKAIVEPKPSRTSQQTPDDDTLKKYDPSTSIDNDLIHDQADRTSLPKEYNGKCESEFQELEEIEFETVRSPSMEVAQDNYFIDLQSCASRVDFSSVDDTRNLTLKLSLDKAASVCEMTCVEKRQNQDYESRRRSVQWNSEVDVIYYAGDTDGGMPCDASDGKVVDRKMEPLREEADQQACRNGFIKLALNQNLISAFNTYKFRERWGMMYHK